MAGTSPMSVRSDWEGYYLDGRTAARRRAAVRLLRSGIQITPEGGETRWWPYAEIRQTQGFYAGEQVRLERGGDLPEALLVEDAAFLADLHRVAPEAAPRFHDPARRGRRIRLTLLAALATAALCVAAYLWGIPLLAAVAASRVPVAWEERLGESVARHLAPDAKRCKDPSALGAIQTIVARLTAAAPQSPYTIHLAVANQPAVNAFAAPGGYLVVLRGLLEQTDTPEELAGVLAHELQHVLHRHATRAIIQQTSTGLILTALTGDASGATVFGLEGARTLGMLRYTRQLEEEADAEALRLLRAAQIDPAGMLAFLERLQKRERGPAALGAYLSTHPDTGARIARLRALLRDQPGKVEPLLPGRDWRDVRMRCRTEAGAP